MVIGVGALKALRLELFFVCIGNKYFEEYQHPLVLNSYTSKTFSFNISKQCLSPASLVAWRQFLTITVRNFQPDLFL